MSTKSLHKTGVWLSFLCTIHCLAMPFVVTALPFLGESVIDETAEHYLIFGSVVLALFLLIKDFRLHRNKQPLLLLAASTLFSFVGVFVVEHRFETPFVIIGAVLMATSYFINWRKHQAVCVH
ncbi:MAG: MerC domain-containing protein [Spirosomataceae bacterium]